MVSQVGIKFYTNKMLDEVIVNNKCKNNSMSIHIPFSYAKELVDLDWAEITFAISNYYFDVEDAIEFAQYLMEKGHLDDYIISLACMNKNEITRVELLDNYLRILMDDTQYDENIVREKILYVIMNCLYDDRKKFENPFRVI